MLRTSGKAIAAVTLLAGAAVLAACGEGPHLLYGFLEADGQWAITPRYTDATPPQEGLMPVETDGAWGFVDAAGKVVIEPRFDKVLPFSEGLAAVLQGAAWSFIDRTGDVAIAGPFDAAEPFRGGLAAVAVDDRWGFVDHAGVMVIAAQFEELGDFETEMGIGRQIGCFSEGLCAARQGERWGFIDRSGTWVIQPRFGAVFWFQESLAVAQEWTGEDENEALFGFIDRHGEWVIAPTFSGCLWFSGGRAVVQVEVKGTATANEKVLHRTLLIDRHGSEVAELGWDEEIFDGAAMVLFELAPDYLAEGMVPATDGRRWGFMDRDGRWVIAPQYALVFPFKGGLAPAALGDESAGLNGTERWGLIDRAGRWVVEAKLTALGQWDGASIPARRGALWGLLDRDGRWRVEPRYPEVRDVLDFPGMGIAAGEGLFRFGVYVNHRWAAIDPRGRRSKAVEYEWLEDLAWWPSRSGERRPRQLAYLREGLWGLADASLQPVTPPQFDSAPRPFGPGPLLVAEQAGLTGCIDVQGRWVVPPEFSQVDACARDGVRARRDGTWGTWNPRQGWRPDGPGSGSGGMQEDTSRWVYISGAADATWRPAGEGYRLFIAGAPVESVAVVDEVRPLEVRATRPADQQTLAAVRRDGRWGVLDERGGARLAVRYEAIGAAFDGLVAVRRDGLWSIVDLRGREWVGPRSEELYPFNRRVAIIFADGLCGLVDRDGKVLLPPTFSFMRPLSTSLAEAGMSHPDGSTASAGVVDASGRVLVRQDYYSVSMFSSTRLLAWDAKGYHHLLDASSGRPAEGAPQLAGAPGKLLEGLAAVDVRTTQGDTRAGYIDETGRLAIDARYDAGSAGDFENGTAVVALSGRCGVIDRRGRPVLPLEYQHCQRLADGRVLFAEEAPLRIAAPVRAAGGTTPLEPGSPAP